MGAYLDNAATTPLRPSALEAMLPFLTDHFGNPAAAHAWGRRARQAVDEAREVVASCLGCAPREVVFTSGGTEADNLAVVGPVVARGGTAVCAATEHHAVLHSVRALGGAVIGVDGDGVVDLDSLRDALGDDVRVVSVMLANNEVGTVQPLADVVALVRDHAPGAYVHTDAVQGFRWLDVTTVAAGADLVAVSAHKFGGPKGVGALVVRDGVDLAPILHGGGQERDRRSGTTNVAGVVGMATAMREAVAERDAVVTRVAALRERLVVGIGAAVPGVVETGGGAPRVPGVCNLRFHGVENEALLVLLDDAGVAASAASACASGALDPSHVLAAMGVPRHEAMGSVRFSFGSTTTEADVDLAVKATVDAVSRLRSS